MTCRSLYLCLSVWMFWSCNTSTSTMTSYSETRSMMGSSFVITALADDSEKAQEAVAAAFNEVERIEKLISSWDPNSETSAINRQAGQQPIQVSKELYKLIERSIKVSKLTNGVFDISFASIDHIWKFDGTMDTLPNAEDILRSVQFIDYGSIMLDPENQTVYLPEPEMKIGFGAIGKGYAANRCKAVMQELGIQNGVVNAGGDLITWGAQENGQPWSIGIVNPKMKESALSWLEISDLSVVTSGNYERYVDFGGTRYSHIIDPRTGWPAEMLTSVTIICPDAELGDALATAVFILGPEEGIQLIDMIKDVEAFIVDDADSFYHSRNIDLSYYRD